MVERDIGLISLVQMWSNASQHGWVHWFLYSEEDSIIIEWWVEGTNMDVLEGNFQVKFSS